MQDTKTPDHVVLSLIKLRYTPELIRAIDARMEAASLHLVQVTGNSRSYRRTRKATTQIERAEAYVQSVMYKLFDLPGLQWARYSTIKTVSKPIYTLSRGTVFYRPDNPSQVQKGLRFTMR